MTVAVDLPEKVRQATDLLRPAPLPDGTEPEARLVFCGITWDQYLAFDKALGHDRPDPRFYYLDGTLEIMTTSNEHERIAEWIAGLLEIFLEEATDLEIMPRGHATMRILKEAGAEPDKSWCIGKEKQFPELVLEVALTSGGISKLEIYRLFKIPEVWFWRRNKIEIFSFESSGEYKGIPTSRLMPTLDLSMLERCLQIRSWREARQTFRAHLKSTR